MRLSGLWGIISDSRLVRVLSLKPHGDSLLSSTTAFWIFFARIGIALMALVESLSWGYIGTLLGNEPHWKLVFGILVGVIVFLIVWGIDANLMTLDVSKYSRRTQSVEADEDKDSKSVSDAIRSGLSTTWEFIKWPTVPVGVRIFIVLASLYVTAPFISMYILRLDIDKEIDSGFQAAYLKVKAQLERSASSERAERTRQINAALAEFRKAEQLWADANRTHANEVAGIGPSGKHGDGPAAKAALRNAVESKIAYDQALELYNNLSNVEYRTPSEIRLASLIDAAKRKDFQTLKAAFGIQDVPNSFAARNKVLDGFKDKPEFTRIEYSVMAFLMLIATSLFLQKYFEPESVRIYFGERRQSQWSEYLRGKYDSVLDEKNKSTSQGANVMSPFAFCDLWDNIIHPIISNSEYAQAFAKVEQVLADHADALNRLATNTASIKKLKKEIDECKNKVAETTYALAAARDTHIELKRNSVAVLSSVGTEPASTLAETINDRLEDLAGQINAQGNIISDLISKEASLKSCLSMLEHELRQLEDERATLISEVQPVIDLRNQVQQKKIQDAAAAVSKL